MQNNRIKLLHVTDRRIGWHAFETRASRCLSRISAGVCSSSQQHTHTERTVKLIGSRSSDAEVVFAREILLVASHV